MWSRFCLLFCVWKKEPKTGSTVSLWFCSGIKHISKLETWQKNLNKFLENEEFQVKDNSPINKLKFTKPYSSFLVYMLAVTNQSVTASQEPFSLVSQMNQLWNSLSTFLNYVTLVNVIICLWALFVFIMTLFMIIYIKKHRARRIMREDEEKLNSVNIERY